MADDTYLIKSIPGDKDREFDSRQALIEWLDKERKTWGHLEALISDQEPIVQNHIHLAGQFSRMNAMFSIASDAGHEWASRLNNEISHANLTGWLFYDSSRAKYLLKEIEKDPAEGFWLLAGWVHETINYARILSDIRQTNQPVPRAAFLSLQRGAAHAAAFDMGLKNLRADAERDALQDITTDAVDLVERLDAQLAIRQKEDAVVRKDRAATSERSREHLHRVFKWNRYRIDRIRKRYREELQLLAPAEYWEKKAAGLKVSARNWAIAFTVVIVIAIGGILLSRDFVNEVVRLDRSRGDVIPYGTLLLVATPIFFVIWTLRILSRLMLQSIALRQDALERVEMAKSYLALLDEGKVQREDQILILHSLFRPAATGSVDDASPPHWFDLLTGRLKKRE